MPPGEMTKDGLVMEEISNQLHASNKHFGIYLSHTEPDALIFNRKMINEIFIYQATVICRLFGAAAADL